MDTVFDDWKKALQDLQDSVSKDLEEIRRQKAEVQQIKSDIFNKMGEGLPMLSTLISSVFFAAILAAALTSAISMLEVGVAFLTDEKGMKRRSATLLLAFLCWVVGVLCSLSFGSLSGIKVLGLSFFDFLDHLCSDWLLPLGGLIFTLFVG